MSFLLVICPQSGTVYKAGPFNGWPFFIYWPVKKAVPVKKSKKQKGNSRVNSILFNSSWQIDHHFAVAQLSRYLEEISLLEKGVPFEDLGIKERKSAQQTKVFSLQSGSYISSPRFSAATRSQHPDPDPEVRINVDSPAPDLDPDVEVSANNVAHMHLSGVMFLEDQLSTRGAQSLIRDIREMNADPSFIGGLIEVDSGGGESLAGAAIEQAVKESKKPIVALVHQGLSAAYRAICFCDAIIAVTDSSQFGSIGSMLKIDKFLAEIDKLQFLTIYATQSPDKNKEFRAFQESGDTSGLQALVDQGAIIFQDTVRAARTLGTQEQDTLSGGIFRAQDSISRGLADGVGGLETAINQIRIVLASNNSSNSQNQIDMSILSKMSALFGREISSEEEAEAAITQLQQEAGQITEEPETEEVVNEDTPEEPEAEQPETEEEPVEAEPEGELAQILNLLQSQNGILQDLTARVTSLETAAPTNSKKISDLSQALNRMKIKAADQSASPGIDTGEQSLKTETKPGEKDSGWKFSEKEMDKLYNAKKPHILHSNSVN